MSLMGPETTNLSISELDSLISHMINYSTYDPSTGTVDDIINSGKLNIIQNKALKINISNWSGMFNDVKKDIQIANDHAFSLLLGFLNDKVNLKNVAIPKDITEPTQMNIEGQSHFPTNYDALMQDMEFENLVHFHALNLIYLNREYIQIKGYLEENLELLEGEIHN